MGADMPLRTYRQNRRPLPNMKVANTNDTSNRPLNYVTVKRPRKSLGAVDGANEYATDQVAQAQLIAACRDAGYPLVKGDTSAPDGLCTSRVPVSVLGMSLEETFESRRALHNGAGVVCTCCEWRLKTQEEAARDGLPWDERLADEYGDDEAYHIGEATWQGWKSTGQGKDRRTVRDGSPVIAPCNPLKCPYNNGQHEAHGLKAGCKLSITIYLKARGWGNDAPFRVESVGWETNSRFPASWDLIAEAALELLVGAPLDLVLDWSKKKPTPDGTSRPRPFWTLDLPWGMTWDEVREAAIARGRKLLEQTEEAVDLRRQLVGLWAEARSPAGLLGGGAPVEDLPALPPAQDNGPLSPSERDVLAVLVNQGGVEPLQAEALVRANAEDLDGLLGRMGLDRDAGEDAPEVEAEPQPAQVVAPQTGEEVLEGDFEEERPPVDVYEEDVAAADDEAVAEPVEEQPEPAPAEIAPMFPGGCPNTAEPLRLAFEALGETALFSKLLHASWHKATGTARGTVPTPSTCADPDQYAAVLGGLHLRAENWWLAEGYAKYGGGAL